MQPETTDRLTEDTNVNNKRILNRKTNSTSLDAGDAYWDFYESSEDLNYAKAENNTYCLEGYFGNLYGSYATITLLPLNHMEIDTSTGKMALEGYATTQDTGSGFVTLDIFLSAAKSVVDFENLKIYRILYTTKITEEAL